MDPSLLKAVDEFDRAICSVNYRGSFARVFSEVFSNTLGIVAILRQRYEEACDLKSRQELRSYKITAKETDDLLKKILESKKKTEANKEDTEENDHTNENLRKTYTDKYLYPTCEQYKEEIGKKNHLNNIKIDIESIFDGSSIDISQSNPRNTKIKSVIRIPIIIRSSEVTTDKKGGEDSLFLVCSPLGEEEYYCKFSNDKDSKCSNCKFKLLSVFEVYSSIDSSELEKKLIGSLYATQDAFLYRLLDIFYMQEEPECYGSPIPESKKLKKICSMCGVRDSCWIGYEADSSSKGAPYGMPITNRMTPDEVIAQLFEKCKEIIDREVQAKVSFLRYRGDLRKFQYRGIHAMELDVNPYKDREIPEHIKLWKNALQKKKKYDDTDICQDLLEGSIVKNIYDMESGVFVAAKDVSFSCGGTLSKLEADSVKFDEFNDDGTIPKTPRLLLEKLAFDYPLYIAMPTYYMGQLLGIIFVNFDPPKGHGSRENVTKWTLDQVYNFKRQFYRISIEFGIMLYHALTYDFISDIVKAYTDNVEHIHQALLLNFNRTFNSCLNCFLPVIDGKVINNNSAVAIGFKDLTGSPSELLKKWLPFSLSVSECKIVDRCFAENKSKILKLDGSKTNGLFRFATESAYADQFAVTHPAGGETSATNKIGIQSVFIIPVRDKKLAGAGFEEGVYLLFFESSKYILQRHSVELLREVSGVLNVVMFGELRQQEILKHARSSAVAAIMGRNMSHNIGSHVLHYHQKNLENKKASSKEGEKFNDEIMFMNYLKTRMDFIANITTIDPSWFYSMDLYNDVLKPFIEQRILLNGIVLSEGICCQCDDCKSGKSFNRHSLIKFTIKKDDKESSTKLENGEYTIDGLEEVFEREKIIVAIPHSFIGLHAFYTILENFIRNSAKHGKAVNLVNNDITSIKNVIKKNKLASFLNLYTINIELDNIEKESKTRNELLTEIDTIIRANINISEGNRNPKITLKKHYIYSIIKNMLNEKFDMGKWNDLFVKEAIKINENLIKQHFFNRIQKDQTGKDYIWKDILSDIKEKIGGDTLTFDSDKDKIKEYIIDTYNGVLDESSSEEWNTHWKECFTVSRTTLHDFKRKLSESLFRDEVNIDEIIRSIICYEILTNIKNEIKKAALNIIISIKNKDDDLIEMTLSDGTVVENFDEIDKSLDSKLIDSKTAILNYEGWGFKEQKISANYLRLGKISYIDDEKYTPPDFYTGNKLLFSRDKTSEKTVSLEFALLKPKLAYLVVNDGANITPSTPWKNLATISSVDKFNIDVVNGIPHEFIIFQNDKLWEQIKDDITLQSLPQRILKAEQIANFPIDKDNLFKAWLSTSRKNKESPLPEVINNVELSKLIKDDDFVSSRYILIDDHGKHYEQAKEFGGYLPYRNNTSLSTYINNDVKKDYDLMEVALTKIFIADERIWSGRNQFTPVSTVVEVSKENLWRTMHIDLVKLNDNTLDLDALKNAITSASNSDFINLSFFIIHQGLIDKLSDEMKVEFDKHIQSLIDDGFYLIVTSGRGALQDKDMKNARFLEFATLESLLNNGDKLSLVKVLFSLRYKKRKDDSNG